MKYLVEIAQLFLTSGILIQNIKLFSDFKGNCFISG